MSSELRTFLENLPPNVREAIIILEEKLRLQQIFKGRFQFRTYTFTGAVTNLKIKHNLGFQPRDIIQTSLTGAGSLTWNYGSFSKTDLDITTTGACVVRAFIGRYEEDE